MTVAPATNRLHGVLRSAAACILTAALMLSSGCRAGNHGAAELEASPPQPARRDSLRLATWNLQWLLAPGDVAALIRDCRGPDEAFDARARSIPCTAAEAAERSDADLDALAHYARALDADVIALQEADGAAAAERIFPGHRFCFTGRAHVQNTGFAIRRGIPFRCGPDVDALSLGDSLRRGKELVLHPGSKAELRLLSVHLKSGCQRGPLASSRKACRTLANQLEPLERWIDSQAAAGRAFAVLGDFNRDLVAEAVASSNEVAVSSGVWAAIDDADPPESDLHVAALGERIVNCTPLQRFSSYIDHIVLSRSLTKRVVPHSFARVTYDFRDATRRKLSDHCPMSIDIRLPH